MPRGKTRKKNKKIKIDSRCLSDLSRTRLEYDCPTKGEVDRCICFPCCRDEGMVVRDRKKTKPLRESMPYAVVGEAQ